MKLSVALFVSSLLLTSPGITHAQTAKPSHWLPVSWQAAFSRRDTADGFVFGGKMWLSNGYYWDGENRSNRDLWSSADGKLWTLVNGATPYDEFSQMTVFNNMMWAVGDSVWLSNDGVRWLEVNPQTPFGLRPYGELVVYDGKMWLLGDGSDVWYSSDGTRWTCATASAPYGNRSGAAVVVFAGKIWVMGGRTNGANTPPESFYPGVTTYNDVWCSADGAHWTRVLEQAPWKPRIWSKAKYYLDRMWIIAGFDNVDGANLNDVWYSADGVIWTRLVSYSTFSPRHEVTPYVFDESLWVVAGNGWPLLNDVWRLDVGTLSPAQTQLSVSFSGAGSGTVTSTPAGLQCASGCSSAFNLGTVVTLKATAAPWSVFTGWSGEGCSGTGDCSVVMSAARNVAAAFASVPFGPLDFNGDGQPGILWRNVRTGEDYVWYMNGTDRSGGESLETVAERAWEIVGTGDFNGDRKPDILWRNSATGQNYLWIMNGVSRSAGALLEAVPDTAWRIEGVADLSGDGNPDILWRNATTGDNYVWYMNGITRVGGEWLEPVPDLNWEITGVAEFNGDGNPDLLWRNTATGEDYVWFMKGVSRSGGCWLEAVPDLNWRIVAVADYNRDGQTDILWRNAATGENYVWFINGTLRFGGSFLLPVADLNWHIAP